MPNVTAAVVSGRAIVRSIAVDPENTVTPRQQELLALYASGYSYAEIGAVKFLSPYTVRNLLASALKRSEARSLTHLCVAMMERGLLRKGLEGDYEAVVDLRVVD